MTQENLRYAVAVADIYEEIPSRLEAIATIHDWGKHYEDNRGNPWALFLDITGYSVENFGNTIYNLHYTLGHYEASLLADALAVWSRSPVDVMAIVDRLERA